MDFVIKYRLSTDKNAETAMDVLSTELNAFLSRLGNNPSCVSEKVEHYMKHILHLLQTDEERIIIERYGLFGNDAVSTEDLARERGLSTAQLTKTLETCLRRLAVTPEWQMVKQLT